MSIMGISDPWILGAYIGCFLSVAFCVIYGLSRGKAVEAEEDAEDGN